MTYCQRRQIKEGPSHGNLKHGPENFGVWFVRYACRQTERQTDKQANTHSSQYSALSYTVAE